MSKFTQNLVKLRVNCDAFCSSVPFVFVPSIVFPMELSYVVFLQSVWLPIPLLTLQMVPFCPSSIFVPLHMCFNVPFSFLSLRFLLHQLCFSSLKHFLDNLL
jgi:hypothetical protein